MMKLKSNRWVGNTVYYAICIVLAVVFAGPFLWMLSSSLKPSNEIFASPPVLISPNATFNNYSEVFRQAPQLRLERIKA